MAIAVDRNAPIPYVFPAFLPEFDETERKGEDASL